MSKKLIFVGSPGSGKTTLRKIFFEGESASRLLDYALEPTHGEESLIFNLIDGDIGIFDLAGQENERWLTTEDKAVFQNAGIVLIVIEIGTPNREILSFVIKVIKVRDEMAPDCNLYLLVHKIDLVQYIEVNAKRRELFNILKEFSIKKIYFTSIKSPFFTKTFSYFVEIIKNNIERKVSDEIIETDLLNEAIRLLYYLDREIFFSKKEILLKLNLTETIINNLIDYLIKKNQIELKKIGDKTVISLTDKGKSNFEYIKQKFPLDNIYKFEDDVIIPEFSTKKEIPPFIGCFIADKDGKTFLKIEIFEGALKSFLRDEDSEDIKEKPFDVELIPMFISALEKFSQEINIKNLSGFDLKGINLKMKIFKFNRYTVIFFTRSSVNLRIIEYKIKSFFLEIFENYKEIFFIFQETGSIENDTEIANRIKEWLSALNNFYEEKIHKLDSYDKEHARTLYSKLDNLQDKLDLTFSILTEKIKKLKINLMKAILDNNLDKITQIAKISQEFILKYHDYTDMDKNEELSTSKKLFPQDAIDAYRETGGIPIRKGNFTQTFKNWFKENY